MKPQVQGKNIDYKNLDLLRTCISEQGKILPRKVTQLDAKTQRHVAKAIKRARILGLMHFTYKN